MKKHPHPDASLIRSQVLRGIAGNREPGMHFPGYFLDLQWLEIGNDIARIQLPDGPHCRDANGEVDLSAVAILADLALANATRLKITPGARLGTIHMQMQFTGVPAYGDIDSTAHFLGFADGTKIRQSLTRATLSAGGKTVCHATGEYLLLELPPGVKLAPLPWQKIAAMPVHRLTEEDLRGHEPEILAACDQALRKTSAHTSFIQQLWGGVPRRTAHGASNRVRLGPHLGNRVGHLQGGISLGIAAACACAAVPATMMLSNVSACYISPGHGKAVKVKSRVVHAGRTVAVVQTEIRNVTGERVLDVVTQHVARTHV